MDDTVTDADYPLRATLRPAFTLVFRVMLGLAVAGLVLAVAGLVLQRDFGLIGLALLVFCAPYALLIRYVAGRAKNAVVTLRLRDKGLQIDTPRGETYLRWADVERVEVAGSAARFFLRPGSTGGDDASVVVSYPGDAAAPEWVRIQEDLAAHLDADRGYQHRMCVTELPAEPGEEPSAAHECTNPLGCAGSDTCELHALKQTRKDASA